MFEKDAKIMAWLLFSGPIFSWFIITLAIRTDFVCATAMVIALFGSYKVLRSKLTQKLRTGILIEWGAKDMTLDEKKKYIRGYAMMVVSVLVIVGQRIIEL